jgi:hypothetical protein
MESGSVRSLGEESSEQVTRVTRSIMIVKPPGFQSGSPPASPAGSTTPVSPFSGKVVIHFFDFIYRVFCFYVTVKIECLLITETSKVKWCAAPKFRAGYICLFDGMA